MMRTLHGIELVTRARCIARDAHAGVLRADGTPYIGHPGRVAAMLVHVGYGAEVIAAAWLHDTVEDSEWTLDDLAGEGIPAGVVAAVDAVSKRPGEAYLEAVARAASDPVGVLVKLADNADNSAPDQRVALPLPKRLTGDYRYAAARSLLRSALYGVPTATPLNAATGARVAALMRERTETGEHTKAAR